MRFCHIVVKHTVKFRNKSKEVIFFKGRFGGLIIGGGGLYSKGLIFGGFYGGGGHSDDTIVGGSGGIPPGNILKFGSLKRHFLHFEGTFEQNI